MCNDKEDICTRFEKSIVEPDSCGVLSLKNHAIANLEVSKGENIEISISKSSR